jgi:hypothetical protein
MDVSDLLIEWYGRLPDLVHDAVEGLSPEDLARPPAEGANTIGWLTWHLTRVQDHHVSELLDERQVWEEGAWAERFGMAPDPDDTGYGDSPDEVLRVRPDGPGAVTGYLDAVWSRTRTYLAELSAADLDEVVDERWDPPVTRGVRLVSVVDDCIQHVGQAAYARGLLGR